MTGRETVDPNGANAFGQSMPARLSVSRRNAMKNSTKTTWGCLLGGFLHVVLNVVGLGVLGVLVAVLEPPIAAKLHEWRRDRKFPISEEALGKFVPMPYSELESRLAPGFTVGDAYRQFGRPRRIKRDEEGRDIFCYSDTGMFVIVDNNRALADQEHVVDSVCLLFAHDFVLQEWWPVVLDGVRVRDWYGAGVLGAPQ